MPSKTHNNSLCCKKPLMQIDGEIYNFMNNRGIDMGRLYGCQSCYKFYRNCIICGKKQQLNTYGHIFPVIHIIKKHRNVDALPFEMRPQYICMNIRLDKRGGKKSGRINNYILNVSSIIRSFPQLCVLAINDNMLKKIHNVIYGLQHSTTPVLTPRGREEVIDLSINRQEVQCDLHDLFMEFDYYCIICGQYYETGLPSIETVLIHIYTHRPEN